jgi:hypothetical protein
VEIGFSWEYVGNSLYPISYELRNPMKNIFPYYICIAGILFDVLITSAGLLIREGAEGNPFLKYLPSKNLILFFLVASNLFAIAALLMINSKNRFFPVALYTIGVFRFFCGLTWF